MILFTIKKAFYDVWDNLFTLVFLNIGFMFLFAGLAAALQALYAVGLPTWLLLIAAGFALFVCALYLGATSMLVGDITDYQFPEFKNFLRYFPKNIKAALVLTLITFFQIFIFGMAIPWYMNQKNWIGLVASAVLFWACLFWWLAAQYYFPVRSRLATDVKPLLLKTFAMFFDNAGYTFVIALGTLVLLLLSFFLAFFFPGVAAILLWHQTATKLRLYKYDYLQSHPGTHKKYVPWRTLLRDDERLTGKRTLKNLIFPWKG